MTSIGDKYRIAIFGLTHFLNCRYITHNAQDVKSVLKWLYLMIQILCDSENINVQITDDVVLTKRLYVYLSLYERSFARMI